MMAVAMWMVAITSTGPVTLGSTCRSMIATEAAGHAGGVHVLLVLLDHRRAANGAGVVAPSRRCDRADQHEQRQLVVRCSGQCVRATPLISSAIRIAGNDSWTSATRMMNASSAAADVTRQRARGRRPARRASSTDANPTPSEIREPYRIVDRMSRPWSSVPSRNAGWPRRCHIGGSNASLRSSEAEIERIVGCDPRRDHRTHGDHQRHDCRGMATGDRRKLWRMSLSDEPADPPGAPTGDDRTPRLPPPGRFQLSPVLIVTGSADFSRPRST